MDVYWVAHLDDNTTLCQCNESGTICTWYKELLEKRNQIVRLEVRGLPMPTFLTFPSGAKPVVFERRRQESGIAEVLKIWKYFGYELGEKKVFLVHHAHSNRISIENTDGLTPDW